MENATDATSQTREKVRIAAFDFDGTCISTNSPVLLVHYLYFKGMIDTKTTASIIKWGARYKFKMAKDESLVRSYVFRGFNGKPAWFVRKFLRVFYEDWIKGKIRQQAIDRMNEHIARGEEVLVVSATFSYILERATEDFPFEDYLCTRMVIDGRGRFTNKVEGLPCEGEEKVRAIERFANERYGVGNWELTYAYGDHHSDIPMLEAAINGYAVTPDTTLTAAAKEKGFSILDWS